MDARETLIAVINQIKSQIPDVDLGDQTDFSQFNSLVYSIYQNQFTKPNCQYDLGVYQENWNSTLDSIFSDVENGDKAKAFSDCDKLTSYLQNFQGPIPVPKPQNKRR